MLMLGDNFLSPRAHVARGRTEGGIYNEYTNEYLLGMWRRKAG